MPTSTPTNNPVFGMSDVNSNLTRKEAKHLPVGFLLALILCISPSISRCSLISFNSKSD
jgi:hypothetical protein